MDRAEQESTRALTLARETQGMRHPGVAEALINLGAIASVRGALPDAERQFREAVALLQGWFGDDHPATASAKTSLAQTLGTLERYAEGQTLLEAALATQRRVFGERHPRTAFVHNELGLLAFRRDDFARAATEFAAAAAAYLAAGHPQAGVSTANLGSVHLAAGAYRPAEEAFRRALELYATSLPPDHLNVGVAMGKLGRSVLRQKRVAEARPLLERAEQVLAKQPGGESTWLKAAREDLASLR